MSRCAQSAGIYMSVTTVAGTAIAPSVRTRSVRSGSTAAGKRLSLRSTSILYLLYLRVCILLRWLIRVSSTTVCSRPRGLKEKGIVIDQSIRKQCFAKAWVVHSKPPAKGVGQVLEYIGRYAYRVAISNSRILDVTDSQISYDYKMYRSGGKHGVMTMMIVDFLNLLSQHILPGRFVRIRHYGFLSPCNREKLRCIQQQLKVPPVPKVRKRKSYLEICNEKGWDIGICKDCNCLRIIMRIIKPAPRAPPFKVWHTGR